MQGDQFLRDLQEHATTFTQAVATEKGEWIVKGFIDVIGGSKYGISGILWLLRKPAILCMWIPLKDLCNSMTEALISNYSPLLYANSIDAENPISAVQLTMQL